MTASPQADTRPRPPAAAYRPDIDGLRAYSILVVLFFHAFPKGLPGGFIGVDVFFVISGFLISGILFKSLQGGTFSYRGFYVRRIKRIFPALTVVLLLALPAGWMFLFREEFRQLGKHVFAGAAFVSNLALMREGGYFDSSVKPLLHLWSLGIEEQFYIVWPLLLALLWRWRSSVLPAIVAVLVISFSLNLVCVYRDPAAAFYFPLTRFWELAIGALLAYASMFGSETAWYRRLSGGRRIANLLSLAGLALLVAAVVLLDEDKAFPGAWALLPTGGAFLTILAGPNAWFNRVVLSSRPVVFFGLISYPLYLWHWPVLVFVKLIHPYEHAWGWSAAAVCTSILGAYLTYRMVETPLRHHRSLVLVPGLLGAGVGLLALAGLLFYVGGNPRLQQRGDARTEQVLAASLDRDRGFADNHGKRHGFVTLSVAGRPDRKVLFLGDSHAAQYYSRVRALAAARPGRIPTTVFATTVGCPPLPGVNRVAAGYTCDRFFNFAIGLADDPQVTTVVFAGYWAFYFGLQADDTMAGRGLVANVTGPSSDSGMELARQSFSRLGAQIRQLRARGKRVFLILNNPDSALFNPYQMVSRLSGRVENRTLDPEWLATARPIRQLLVDTALRAGASIIDPLPHFCPAGCPTMTPDGLPIYFDNNHMRSSYAARQATYLDPVYQTDF